MDSAGKHVEIVGISRSILTPGLLIRSTTPIGSSESLHYTKVVPTVTLWTLSIVILRSEQREP